MIKVYIKSKNILSLSSKKANFVLNDVSEMLMSKVNDATDNEKSKFLKTIGSGDNKIITNKVRLDSSLIRKATGYYTDKLIFDFINSHDKLKSINFIVPEGYSYYNDGDSKTVVTDPNGVKINLSSPTGLASFKIYFESYLKNLTGGVDKSGNELPNYSDTLFNDLVGHVDTDYKGNDVHIFKLPLDMQNLKSTSDQSKLSGYMNKLNDLTKENYVFKSAVDSDGNPILMKSSDLLYLYNLVVNKDRFGSYRLTKLFENDSTTDGTLSKDFIMYQGEVEKDHVSKSVEGYTQKDPKYKIDDIEDLYSKLISDKTSSINTDRTFAINTKDYKYSALGKDDLIIKVKDLMKNNKVMLDLNCN